MSKRNNEPKIEQKVKKNTSEKNKTVKRTGKNDVSKKTKVKVPTSNKKRTPSKTSKKTVAKKVTKSKTKSEIIEYYDLPYRYNQTIVKILAQTPNTLFVYWDISDEDKENYAIQFGKNFFENTIPILIIHNRTKNYSFEIEINDFANSWYFNVNDTNCQYEVELGRKAKYNNIINIPNNYLQIVSSNKIEAPNDHILFEKEQKNVFFRNIKTNHSYSKDIVTLDFMKKIGKIYNIYDIYKKIYKNENFEDIKNPSSY